MATSTALVPRDENRTAVVVTAPQDRTAGVRRARRHSQLVRLLRVGLPIAGLALVGVYTWTVLRTAGFGAGSDGDGIGRILPEKLEMQNPHYEGYGKDGSSYVIDAATARQKLATPNVI